MPNLDDRPTMHRHLELPTELIQVDYCGVNITRDIRTQTSDDLRFLKEFFSNGVYDDDRILANVEEIEERERYL